MQMRELASTHLQWKIIFCTLMIFQVMKRKKLRILHDHFSMLLVMTIQFVAKSCMNHSCSPNAKAFKREEVRLSWPSNDNCTQTNFQGGDEMKTFLTKRDMHYLQIVVLSAGAPYAQKKSHNHC
ncbi:hypothetical protein ACFX1W_024007 [Malus domestica]